MITGMRLGTLVGVLVVVASLTVTARARAQTLTYRGCVKPAKFSAMHGLSGISHARGDGYLVVRDDSNWLVGAFITCRADGSIERCEISKSDPLPARLDFEGIAFSPGDDTVYVSDESPSITQHSLPPATQPIRRLALPEVFRNIVQNQGLESLTLSPDGKSLWTANERALTVDGNPQTPADPIMATTRVRLLRFDLSGKEPRAAEQFEYQTSGVHDWGGTIGLCDLVALPDGRLLALERSAAMNFQKVASIRTRIFLVDTAGAEDISGVASLANRPPAPAPGGGVKKTLLYDGYVCGERGANLEGLCLGPKLGENRWAVIGVVDSTDGGLGLSETSVVSFELDLDAPAPAAATQPATKEAK